MNYMFLLGKIQIVRKSRVSAIQRSIVSCTQNCKFLAYREKSRIYDLKQAVLPRLIRIKNELEEITKEMPKKVIELFNKD